MPLEAPFAVAGCRPAARVTEPSLPGWKGAQASEPGQKFLGDRGGARPARQCAAIQHAQPRGENRLTLMNATAGAAKASAMRTARILRMP